MKRNWTRKFQMLRQFYINQWCGYILNTVHNFACHILKRMLWKFLKMYSKMNRNLEHLPYEEKVIFMDAEWMAGWFQRISRRTRSASGGPLRHREVVHSLPTPQKVSLTLPKGTSTVYWNCGFHNFYNFVFTEVPGTDSPQTPRPTQSADLID